ncbi:hypothetical protein [Nocardioides sp.]|uniref:hypothetical protein n=1 Tax=Nocardioides sp. TaxID=35761 RepID=UPI0039E6804E
MTEPAGLEKLQIAPVLATVQKLEQRIGARFPERGLHRVAGELVNWVEQVAADSPGLRRQLRTARVASRVAMLAVVALAVVVFVVALHAAFVDDTVHGVDWVPLLESSVNDLVFVAIAVFFLRGFPERLQRSATLRQLHRLRSLAHIIDMHQLTKDPERFRSTFVTTSSSPRMDLTPEQLEHYLDYCSELLSLVGKSAALCAEESQDQVVLDTVSTIEALTVSLSRKIWQKIAVLAELRAR